jgi:hypothetical protein
MINEATRSRIDEAISQFKLHSQMSGFAEGLCSAALIVGSVDRNR